MMVNVSYYVNSLKAANSNYAYPTLGSTFAIHAETYAQVRGYPKRNAGEDFHLLNKIAKTNSIQYSTETTISLEARLSDRVPIGTGPSIKKILDIIEKDPSGQSYLSYNPLVFKLLARALKEICSFAIAPCQFDEIIGSKLDELGFQKFASNLHSHYRSSDQRHQNWISGLMRLKLCVFYIKLRAIIQNNRYSALSESFLQKSEKLSSRKIQDFLVTIRLLKLVMRK